MQASDINQSIERVAVWRDRVPWPSESAWIVVAAITELAAGEPVELTRIADHGAASVGAVSDFLHGSPAEFDRDGRLVGLGLTLRPTPHRVEVDGRTLYTWCAPDTLELPVLLGRPVRIESRCFATGKPVRLEVDLDGVRELEPEEAVVSIVLGDVSMSDFRQKLCDEQHFFSCASAAACWHAERPEAIVVPVRSGFALTRMLTARLFGTAATLA
jgi:alkylmercury lyase